MMVSNGATGTACLTGPNGSLSPTRPGGRPPGPRPRPGLPDESLVTRDHVILTRDRLGRPGPARRRADFRV